METTIETQVATIKHCCGHTCDWTLRADTTYTQHQRERRELASARCPRCKPYRWHTMPTPGMVDRPILSSIAAPTAPAPRPIPAALPVAPTTPVARMATGAQLGYLARLGVVVPADRRLTLDEASRAIDSAKRGEGVGWLGLFFEDGSN